MLCQVGGLLKRASARTRNQVPIRFHMRMELSRLLGPGDTGKMPTALGREGRRFAQQVVALPQERFGSEPGEQLTGGRQLQGGLSRPPEQQQTSARSQQRVRLFED